MARILPRSEGRLVGDRATKNMAWAGKQVAVYSRGQQGFLAQKLAANLDNGPRARMQKRWPTRWRDGSRLFTASMCEGSINQHDKFDGRFITGIFRKGAKMDQLVSGVGQSFIEVR